MFVDESRIVTLGALNDNEIEFGEDFHIYAILSRPRSVFKSVKLNEKKIESDIIFGDTIFHYEINLETEYNSTDFKISFNEAKDIFYLDFFDTNDIFDRVLQSCNIDETRLDDLKEAIEGYRLEFHAENILKLGHYKCGRDYDFEVLYIGQSQGRDGKRSVQERLKNHETLQSILIDYHTKHINRQIFIGMFSFKPNMVTVFNGWENEFSATDEEQGEHSNKVLAEFIELAIGQGDVVKRERQMINITEAALIHHFKPSFNEKFVNNFPSEEHSSYDRYYNLEYNMLAITLNLEQPFALYNGDKRVAYYDIVNPISYNLYKDGRRDILSLFEKHKE